MYAKGNDNENICPEGYERIFDSDDCEDANTALGTFDCAGKLGGAHIRGVDQAINSEPCGCYMFAGNYHLNNCPNGVGVASGGIHLYCKSGASRALT